MCGLAGFIEFSGPYASCEDLLRMQKVLSHRGPDDQGHVFEPGIGLCHSRLAIIDLSQKAHQPMSKGHFTIVYNGEIFNFQTLREELISLGYSFDSDSDTEVLLRGYQQWGADVLLRLNGMFAFAVYDRRKKILFLARDRAGIKPLVYYWDKTRFVFASEIKGLCAYPFFRRRLSPEAVEDYLRLGYSTGKQTIWKDCLRLLPGEYMTVDISKREMKIQTYWEPFFSPGPTRDFPSAVKELKSILTEELRQSVVSDVPVGICISGGVDSNVLLSLLTKELGFHLRTYSLSSRDARYDENESAQRVADFFKVDHTSLYLDARTSRDMFFHTVCHYDEPVADQNTLSFRLIAHQARKDGVPVLLSGMGGDELFLGYPHVILRRRIRALFRIPYAVRCLISKKSFQFSSRFYKAIHLVQQKDYEDAVAGILGNYFFDDEIRRLMILQDERGPSGYFLKTLLKGAFPHGTSWAERIMACDLRTYLVDNGLRICDRSSMAEGVEMRVPFLNHRVMEFSLKTPVRLKYYKNRFKALLRGIEEEYLPGEVRVRGKRGFYPFVKTSWLDVYYHDDLKNYWDSRKIKQQGLFSYDEMKNLWAQHERSGVNVSNKIWNMFIFQIWAQHHL